MTDNYLKLARANLERLYGNLPDGLEEMLPGRKKGSAYSFAAFGQVCVIAPDGITLDGLEPPGVIGILLSLYALNATTEIPRLEPLEPSRNSPIQHPMWVLLLPTPNRSWCRRFSGSKRKST